MSSFSNVFVVRHVWRPAGIIGGWVSGMLAVACVAAAVALGGATAAVQRAGTGPDDPIAAWLLVGELLAVGVALAAVAYGLFAAAERSSAEEWTPRNRIG